MHCQTDAKYIEPFEFERLQILNTEYQKQLALNGQVFSQKEKQIDQLTVMHLQADLNFKRAERQLNDIKILNHVKKGFLQEMK